MQPANHLCAAKREKMSVTSHIIDTQTHSKALIEAGSLQYQEILEPSVILIGQFPGLSLLNLALFELVLGKVCLHSKMSVNISSILCLVETNTCQMQAKKMNTYSKD